MLGRLRIACATLLVVCLALPAPARQSSLDAEQYAEQGQRALAEQRYAEAERAFEKLRELQPNVAEVHANLGLIYFQERKYEPAVRALRQALKLKPSLEKSRTLLALSLSELTRYQEALPGLETGFHASSDEASKRLCGLQLLRAYDGLRREGEAVQTALDLKRLYPDDPEVLYHVGRVFGNAAFVSMEKLAEVAPDSLWRHQAAAEAEESQGSFDSALAEYRQVLAIDPRRRGIHYRMGRTLLARSHDNLSGEDISSASSEFEQELRLDPSNANAAYELADIHRQAGQFEDAQRYFEMALQLYPSFEDAHTGLAAVLIARQKPEDALRQLQQAIALNAEDEVAWFRLAQVERTLGNAAEQQKALAEFTRLRRQSNRQRQVEPIFSPRDVTPQQVDPDQTQ